MPSPLLAALCIASCSQTFPGSNGMAISLGLCSQWWVGSGCLAAQPAPPMALHRTPISLMSSAVRLGSALASIALSRNADAYCSRPSPRSQSATSKRHRQRSLVQSVARGRQFGVGSCGPRTFDASIAGSSPISSNCSFTSTPAVSFAQIAAIDDGLANGSFRPVPVLPDHSTVRAGDAKSDRRRYGQDAPQNRCRQVLETFPCQLYSATGRGNSDVRPRIFCSRAGLLAVYPPPWRRCCSGLPGRSRRRCFGPISPYSRSCA